VPLPLEPMTDSRRPTREALAQGETVAPAILVLAGASGAGKTTLTSQLAALDLVGVRCHFFDAIGGGTPLDELIARFPDGDAFRTWALDHWFAHLLQNDSHADVVVLEGQVCPRAVYAAFERHGITTGEVLFVHCSDEERHVRLRGSRAQPELASPEMDAWAGHLRRQAQELGIVVLDTTGATPDESLRVLHERVNVRSSARSRSCPGTRPSAHSSRRRQR
jgi:adenylate kinase family enzyme